MSARGLALTLLLALPLGLASACGGESAGPGPEGGTPARKAQVSGTVMDAATRLPVSGAQVLGPAGMRTSSDADGHFRLGDLAVGTQGEILVTGPDGARGRVPLLPLAPGPLEVVVHLQRP